MIVFGGPYSNLQATQAMQQICRQAGIPPEHVICTGDVVAYCGNPEETTSLVREWGCHVVMGNCEESVGFELTDCGCGFDEGSVCATLSRDWYSHAAQQVSAQNRAWMRSLPRELEIEIDGYRCLVVHGSTSSLNEFIFNSSDVSEKARQIKDNQADVVIGGHSGIPFGQVIGNGAWLNAGVIGMPANEGLASTWYMRIDRNTHGISVRWERLEYDYLAAQENMQIAGLGPEYRESLASGVWPSDSILPDQEKSLTGKPLELPELNLDWPAATLVQKKIA